MTFVLAEQTPKISTAAGVRGPALQTRFQATNFYRQMPLSDDNLSVNRIIFA